MLDKQSYLANIQTRYPDTQLLLRHLHYDKCICSLTLDNLHTLSHKDLQTFYLYTDYNTEVFLEEVDKDLLVSGDKYYVVDLPIKLNSKGDRKIKKVELNLKQSFAVARLSTEFYSSNRQTCIKLTQLFCKEWRPIVWKKIESYLV